MKEQKTLDEATLGFEPASQLPPAKESAAFNHWLCNRCVNCSWELIVLKYLFLLFTLLNLMELYLS